MMFTVEGNIMYLGGVRCLVGSWEVGRVVFVVYCLFRSLRGTFGETKQ